MTLDLQSRLGWPPELRALLEKYPREVWPGHANLGATAQFWLERHDGFRELGGTLRAATDRFSRGEAAAGGVSPLLRAAPAVLPGEPRRASSDRGPPLFSRSSALPRRGSPRASTCSKATTRRSTRRSCARWRARTGCSGRWRAMTMRAAPPPMLYADTSERLLKFLVRHLDDEEDLIMPVILDQGERKLFGDPVWTSATIGGAMTTRQASCSCGQLQRHLRGRAGAHFHVPLQRLPEADRQRLRHAGAISARAGDDRRSLDAIHAARRQRQADHVPLLPSVRFDGLLGARRMLRISSPSRSAHSPIRASRRPATPSTRSGGTPGCLRPANCRWSILSNRTCSI